MSDRPLEVAVVMGTYNRLPLLKRAVESIRRAVGPLTYRIIIADGGSTDGTVEWLQTQSDVEYIAGDLSGAVANFNRCFARAVDLAAEYVVTFNDDDEFMHHEGAQEIWQAVGILRREPGVGAVAFQMNTRGPWEAEKWAGIAYGNTCCMRRETGMAVARAQGDPSGKAWWGHTHGTYAADTEAGLWAHRLGWEMREGVGLRVRDYSHPDALKARNVADYGRSGTARLFTQRFGDARQCAYNAEDARRYGGRVR